MQKAAKKSIKRQTLKKKDKEEILAASAITAAALIALQTASPQLALSSAIRLALLQIDGLALHFLEEKAKEIIDAAIKMFEDSTKFQEEKNEETK